MRSISHQNRAALREAPRSFPYLDFGLYFGQFDGDYERITALTRALGVHSKKSFQKTEPYRLRGGSSSRKQPTITLWQSVAASETSTLPKTTECRKVCHRNKRLSNCSSKIRSFNRNFVNSTPIPSSRTTFRTIASACTLPPGTSNASLSFVPTGGGLGTEMNNPPPPSVRTREKSCRSVRRCARICASCGWLRPSCGAHL